MDDITIGFLAFIFVILMTMAIGFFIFVIFECGKTRRKIERFEKLDNTTPEDVHIIGAGVTPPIWRA